MQDVTKCRFELTYVLMFYYKTSKNKNSVKTWRPWIPHMHAFTGGEGAMENGFGEKDIISLIDSNQICITQEDKGVLLQ